MEGGDYESYPKSELGDRLYEVYEPDEKFVELNSSEVRAIQQLRNRKIQMLVGMLMSQEELAKESQFYFARLRMNRLYREVKEDFGGNFQAALKELLNHGVWMAEPPKARGWRFFRQYFKGKLFFRRDIPPSYASYLNIYDYWHHMDKQPAFTAINYKLWQLRTSSKWPEETEQDFKSRLVWKERDDYWTEDRMKDLKDMM